MRSLILLFAILFFAGNLYAQIYPVSLESRIVNSSTIAIATLKSKHSYWDQYRANIYTLNVMEVTAYLKGHSSNVEIAIITEGGIVGSNAQINYPETKINPNAEYCVFLIPEDFEVDDKRYRSLNPNTIQCKAVARIHGALPFQDGKYHDVFNENPFTERELLEKIQRVTGINAIQPDGSPFVARQIDDLNENNGRLVVSITSLEDGDAGTGPYNAGTIDSGKELIINGTGFESTQGNGKVEFDNADDGGATFIEPPNTSDYISWSDTEIRVKIPADAGTGVVKVSADGGSSDTESITIDWAINPVDDDFYLWPSDSRNRVELIDSNGIGGYTFEYSTVGGFSGNTDAEEAFERALVTWRCDNGVNFERDDSGTGTGYGSDGVNIVMFASLGGSTLGVATSRYTSKGNSSCDLEDTFWWLREIDIRFDSGTSWYYGSGACSSGEYDFETVALHELGHAHGLGHIIDALKTMNWSIGTCTDSDNIRRTLSSVESAAAAHKMGHSTMSNCFSSPPPMTAVPGGSCSMLPVELIDFSGNLKEKKAHLNWQTATEINNDYFSLERSLDARNFETIAIIKGQGTSYESHSYDYFDESPAIGVTYYRLKQTDFDGTFEIFDKIVAINFVGDVKAEIRPNPVRDDNFQLIYYSNQSGDLQVEIFNITGKRLYQKEFSVRKDLNYFDISLVSISNGIYIVKNNQNNFVENIRFVKTN